LSLPDLYSVVSTILGLVSPESYHVGHPVTRPQILVEELEMALGPYMDCHILASDINAQHNRWSYFVDVGGHYTQGIALNRILADVDFMVPLISTHDCVSVIALCAFWWTPHKYRFSLIAGLPHVAQVIKIASDTAALPPQS